MAKNFYDLVILAAGMGSRFGGLKQVEPVGPNGELIIEYSAYDGLRAGFDRLVLVIRKDTEADFRATIGKRLEARMDVKYVFQELDDSGRSKTAPLRSKPWGTGHAVLVCRDVVQRPFAVINADDFYGAAGYAALAAHFAARPDYALVGYPLQQTLSDHGTVSRGLCATDETGRLRSITEVTRIARTPQGAAYTGADGTNHLLNGHEMVSMNNWGFTPALFPQLEELFAAFCRQHDADPKAEFYLPTAVSELIARGSARVSLLRTDDEWFGLTYREDVATARQTIKSLIAAKKYPSPLWG